jgi:hypothetical protein
MTKKKKGKVVQMLSPENYVRQKARTLPLHECRINSSWEEEGLAHVSVARKHSNGNITMGIYLVDLKCLGVKDAYFFFNISEHQYKEILDNIEEEMDTDTVSYTLAHNIIYAGIEFAGDYGFKPHKDFTSVAQYILEEDTDDIELIEIECGANDKPLYIRGPLDSDARANQIIAQLEREAGPENYEVIWQTEEDFMKDGIYKNEDWDKLVEKYEDLSTEEKVDIISEKFADSPNLSAQEQEEIVYLMDDIISDYLDFDLADSLSNEISEKLQNYEITGELSDELLGIDPDSQTDRKKWGEQFSKLYYLASNKPKSAQKKLKKLQKNKPENPALAFIELITLQALESPDYAKKLNYYYQQFPDYTLIKIFRTTYEWLKNSAADPVALFKSGPELFFAGKKSLHYFELFHYMLLLLLTAGRFENISLLEALEMIYDEMDIQEEDTTGISEIIAMAKMSFVLSLKEETETKTYGSPAKKQNQTYQFKIQIKGITHPPVWRRITVPSGYSFYDFHRIIQKTFGWWNSHLFQFSEKGFGSRQVITKIYEEHDPGFEEQFEAREIMLSNVFRKEKQKIVYIYDFGDNWEHIITLEKILPEQTTSPDLLAGKGQCPPEDCGGVWGYKNFKEIMGDKNHPEYEEYAEWCGLENEEEWDPKEFDLEETRLTVRNMFK